MSSEEKIGHLLDTVYAPAAPMTEEAALAEMAAWLKGGRRSVALYHRPDLGTVEVWANQAAPKGVMIAIPHDWSTTAPTIAEAWAALRSQSGWPA